MKAVIIIAVLAVVGFGVYWFIIKPRREAEQKVNLQASLKSASSFLRGVPLAA